MERIDIVVAGKTRIISPAGASWNSWFDGENVSRALSG
ncbi:hypothetical protein ALP10_05613 [Pseudomonas syringae pv. helianthi]|uniref:Uncharacterized protein n=1 Tax=Pseudomonas syringae pv. helianthi TaxID=251654 RepID=A0A3M4S3M8_9PSED|nr:hypothetical protein ALP93_04771 [Pseudomonas syringae pv. helianthi]RMV52047.1 hypothetical protein ALP10_05613 [Pseudomonas syringae pv. helianthi]RMW18318.1 hypothetical protein ALO97_04799 [Pseudomonas syringae pv. tagetis]